ncbi:GTP cyclohydrolase I [Salinarchaeum sp. Harcht-Bsk1]|uniref:GTP cyclohydrolase I n=1 Tax=Salinarchaeum sp. Harcht-Bsk1 TaxID=1333523 RepID=UPI0003422880|nr:GTP cyclohydrolase I FolE [Salinarchaeum sp. Harcht-Bsk1]AGN01161.1 GTP cyclohydrolase I [Salinarchaeum sp. Harcht-Bsk1]
MTDNQLQYEETTADPVEDSEIDLEKARRGTRLLLEAIGEEPEKAPLAETWDRRVPAMMETLTEGTRETAKPDLRTFGADTDELVVKTEIPIYSLCEHHMLPFFGVAHIGYRPGEEIVGLSKLPRYVRWQSRRLATQEGLTADIAEGLQDELDPESVIVEVSATHLCEAMRGVETRTETTSRATAGDPNDCDRTQFDNVLSNL